MFFEFCKLISKAIRYFRFRKTRKVVDKWRSNVIEIQREREAGEGASAIEDIEDIKEQNNENFTKRQEN